MKTLLTILLAFAGTLFGAESPPIDLLALKQGIAKPNPLRAENIDPTTDNEFLDYSRAFVNQDGKRFFTIPKEDSPEKYRYVGLGPIPIRPLRRYGLLMEFTSLGTNYNTLTCITFMKGDARTHFNGIDYKKDFGTPPDADRMVLWLGVSAYPNRLTSGPKLAFDSLKLVDRGPLNGNPSLAGMRPGENLLPFSDFENEPLGTFTNANWFAGCGPDAKKWKDVRTEIVKDGSKCLHVVAGPNDYVYPRFHTRPVNLNNSSLLLTYRVKGKGKMQPGIWWWLKGVQGTAWSYYVDGPSDLTDSWRTVRAWRACVDDTDYAAFAFHIQSPEADFYVDDLSLTIIPPEP